MIAFTTDELLGIFRLEVDDPLEGSSPSTPDDNSLWSNAEIYQYMTEAADKVAKKVEGRYQTLQIAITPATVTVPPTPVPLILLRKVLHIREAKLVNSGYILEPINADDHIRASYNSYGPPFRYTGAYTYGVPMGYMRDYENNALILTPIPNITDTLELQCTVTIDAPLAAGGSLPYTDTEDLRLMLHFMKKLAYEKQDADTLDLQRSQQWERQFESGALNRSLRLRSYRRRPGQVLTDW